MDKVLNETTKKANGATQDFKNKIQNTGANLEKMSHDVGEKAGEFASNITHTASDYIETSRDYVKENPIKGVAIAAAAGVVAGGLLSMAMRRKH